MPELALDDRSIIVMAHPDDEVLWASSALARAGRLLIAYEALPGRPDITAGRQAALARFPRPVESLRLPETASFGAAAWPDPVETPEGLAVAAGPFEHAGASTPPPTAAASSTLVGAAPAGARRGPHGDHPRPLGRVRPRGPRAAVPRRRGAKGRARFRALGAGPCQRPLVPR